MCWKNQSTWPPVPCHSLKAIVCVVSRIIVEIANGKLMPEIMTDEYRITVTSTIVICSIPSLASVVSVVASEEQRNIVSDPNNQGPLEGILPPVSKNCKRHSLYLLGLGYVMTDPSVIYSLMVSSYLVMHGQFS